GPYLKRRETIAFFSPVPRAHVATAEAVDKFPEAHGHGAVNGAQKRLLNCPRWQQPEGDATYRTLSAWSSKMATVLVSSKGSFISWKRKMPSTVIGRTV